MASWCLPGHGSGSTKGKPAAQLGCCYKTKGLDGSEDSLSPRLDFQLHQEDQVLSTDTSQPLPDTTDACDLSRTDRMSPLLLAPAKSSLLACPQGLCALQKTPLGRVPQDLREDRKHQPPGLREGPADSERLTSNRDEMGSQPGRCPCPPLPPLTTSSSPDARLNRKSSAPLSFWPWLPPSCISKELPTYIYPPFPGYPLLPPPYLFAYEPLPFSQCSRLLVLTPDTAYPTVAASSLLMTANGAGPHITQEKTLFLYSRAFQSAGHTLHSQVRSRSSRDASTPGRAGVAAPAKRAMPGSRAGAVALPYPLKKENGRILYECNVCGKNFGQLSNLKVHLRVHSGERPFQCDLCQKTFTQLAHLQKHHLVHTREQPHRRQMCHKRSSSSGNLKTHLRLHSGAQSSQCRVCPSHLTPHVYLKLHQRLQASRDPWPGPHPPGPLLSQLPCPRSTRSCGNTRSCGSTVREEHGLGCAQGQGVLALPGEEQGQPG